MVNNDTCFILDLQARFKRIIKSIEVGFDTAYIQNSRVSHFIIQLILYVSLMTFKEQSIFNYVQDLLLLKPAYDQAKDISWYSGENSNE